MTYPGGKNGDGVYQTIINQMPPHQVYIEPFLGSGAIMRLKRPAPAANIGIDIDSDVINTFKDAGIPRLRLRSTDALLWLLTAPEAQWTETMIYLDPPYLPETRSSQRPIYRYEMTEENHRLLLKLIKSFHCMVILSGYYSDLYATELAGWRTVQFTAQRRSGTPATEWLWMNYPEPFELHDYRYLGANFRERERIKRKKARWVARLAKTSATERYALLEAIQEYRAKSAGSITANSDAGDRFEAIAIIGDMITDSGSAR